MRITIAMCGLSALLLGGCATSEPARQPSEPASTPSLMTQSASPTAAARGTAITVADSPYGKVLFDGTGQAIYLFDKEKSTTPECYDTCAAAWPPVLTDGAPQPTAGTRADQLGTTSRKDGTVQVTYAGHPLYFYAHEAKNQVTCHNVTEFGGLWLAVAPSGEAAPH